MFRNPFKKAPGPRAYPTNQALEVAFTDALRAARLAKRRIKSDGYFIESLLREIESLRAAADIREEEVARQKAEIKKLKTKEEPHG